MDKQTKAQIDEVTIGRLEQLPLGRKTTNADKNNFKDTLKKEIETLSGTYDNLYYIDQDKISTKKSHTYIIDVQNEQIYDVEGEKFFKKWHLR